VAKKTRTPPPPRRPVQSPKPRPAERQRPQFDDRRRNQVFWGLAAVGLVTVIVVLVVVLAGGGSGTAKNLTPTLAAAGCTFHTYPSQGRGHYLTLHPKDVIKYNSFPPTSGKHYYVPAVWGNYTSPLVPIQEVHNLEHGGIIIQYGSSVPRAEVDKINTFYSSDPVGMLVAPLPALGDKIALTAWTHLATCTHVNDKAFKAFRDAYRFKGPESPVIPLSAMQPGV